MKRIFRTGTLPHGHRFSGEQIYRRDLLNLVRRWLRILTGIGFAEVLGSCTGAFSSFLVGTRVRYPLTVSALHELYADEFQSRLTYLAYSKRALSDNYPAIAHLFAALAASDLVHLSNFTASLIDLGLEPKKPPPPEIQYLNTKENLK
ncbi:MAG: hypothetical protein GTN81_10270 [Proteobacteria bacterium]|nr:hypothetical protein [Pseudomonadota bacterium]